MAGGRYFDGEQPIDLLPVPDAEADALAARVTSMIEQLDALVVARASGRESKLVDWVAPNRATWDEDFVLSQLDLSAAIDELQTFRGSVEAVVDDIRQHNHDVWWAHVLSEDGS